MTGGGSYNQAVVKRLDNAGSDDAAHATTQRRFWFQVVEVELPWLRLSETAFLLWVLAGLVLIWLVVAVFLLLL